MKPVKLPSAILAILVAVVSGCASAAAPRAYLFDHLRERASGASSINFDKQLDDWLPNQKFRTNDSVQTLGSGIVLGSVVEVKSGRAYIVTNGDADSGTEVAFDDKAALWRTLDVTFKVNRAWTEEEVDDTVRFGISISGSAESGQIKSALSSLDSAIVVLARPGFFKYDRTLYGVGRSGTLLGTIDASGAIAFPSLELSPKGFLSATPSVASLEEQAKLAPPIIQISG